MIEKNSHMSNEQPLAWINGQIFKPEEAKVSIFDRGFLYGDGVYELARFFNGVGVGMEQHVSRLSRSLAAARIDGFDPNEYISICDTLMDALQCKDACVYIQVTRGVEVPRRHAPMAGTPPTVVAIGSPSASIGEITEPEIASIAILPDLRRHRCDIKAISLIDNVMETITASEYGAAEPLLHVDGILTEGASSNVFIVEGDHLLTPGLKEPRPILEGVMRHLVIDAAQALGIDVIQGRIGVDRLQGAPEAFITSSRRLVGAITSIDGKPFGSGAPGADTMRIFKQVRKHIEEMVHASQAS